MVWIDIEGIPFRAWSKANFEKIARKWGELVHLDNPNDLNKYSMRICVKIKVHHVIVESFKVIVKGKIFIIRAKEVTGWAPDFVDADPSSSEDESDKSMDLNQDWLNDKDAEVVEDSLPHQVSIVSGDPFGLNDLIFNQPKNKEGVLPDKAQSGASFPPGFTPLNSNHESPVMECTSNIPSPIQGLKSADINSLGEVNVQGLGGKDKKKWVRNLCSSNRLNFISVQETKMVNFLDYVIRNMCGTMSFDFASIPAQGRSGGSWLPSNTDLLISVYSPQELSLKRVLWTFLTDTINHWRGEVVVMGDFNEAISFVVSRGRFLCGASRNLEHGGSIFSKSHGSAQNKLEALKQRLKAWSSTGLPDDAMNRLKLARDLDTINEKEALDLAQKAKVRWAIEGDENSNLELANDLEVDVTSDEIKKAVWDCGPDKSPGPDGFTLDFFKRFWSIVEEDVILAVKEFFSSGVIPNGCNSSFIALIPKTAFIKGRQIMNGPIILNEVISWCKAKKEKAFFFKVDFQKAFDSVRWDHIDDILNKFGFGSIWRRWIKGCLISSKASVLVNGSPTEEFSFHRGLHQGDPLSLFLFIFVMESLHVSFQRLIDCAWNSWFANVRLNSLQKSILEASFSSLWRHIWIFRNAFLFSDKKPLKSMLFDNFVSHTYVWVKNRCRFLNCNWVDWLRDPLNAISM
uniref:RNA-directed DNA polymerase, eukaryota, reverse transcriptase zinc-binding domain protein n=1 Tax=Tanacetum cinerariifolium TaxID=118510 RepID=A0A6L2KMK3_TANCI|nr:RNA-directed DNA polymerase, eukaryota, reverse transcriptase zinc-binding domain protein [Tanacetum cinerariifolium]